MTKIFAVYLEFFIPWQNLNILTWNAEKRVRKNRHLISKLKINVPYFICKLFLQWKPVVSPGGIFPHKLCVRVLLLLSSKKPIRRGALFTFFRSLIKKCRGQNSNSKRSWRTWWFGLDDVRESDVRKHAACAHSYLSSALSQYVREERKVAAAIREKSRQVAHWQSQLEAAAEALRAMMRLLFLQIHRADYYLLAWLRKLRRNHF
jgi:hypothetical protein